MKRLLIPVLLAATMTAISASSTIFEFGAGETSWFIRNDAVMGGVSSSRLRIDDGVLTFSGRARLENGGGFAGIRSNIKRVNLTSASSLTLRVRGDGKRYALQLLTSSASRVTYRAEFATRVGQWDTVRVPLQNFYPTRSGNRLSGPALDKRNVAAFGLTFGNGRAENFRLEVDWMRAE
jgi:NADH dehydrogenase [ubiquinone] 1 alpha subcomplex assembly factor 1